MSFQKNNFFSLRQLVAFFLFLAISMNLYSIVRIDEFIQFSDSLGDTGNTHKLTKYLLDPNENTPPNHFPYWEYYTKYTIGHLLQGAGLMNPLPGYPYAGGRFSDGKLSCEYIVDLLSPTQGIEKGFLNLAYGGSMVMPFTGTVTTWGQELCSRDNNIGCTRKICCGVVKNLFTGKWWMLPTMLDMANYYLSLINKGIRTVHQNTVVAFLNGGNDYINHMWSPEKVVGYQVKKIEECIAAGVMHVALGAVPNPQRSPCLKDNPSATRICKYVDDHNRIAREEFSVLQSKHGKNGIKLTFIDVDEYIDVVLDNHDLFGVPCIDCPYTNINFTGCTFHPGDIKIQHVTSHDMVKIKGNKEKYFFIDPMHPTERVHQIVTLFVAFALIEAGYFIDEKKLFKMAANLHLTSEDKAKVFWEYKSRWKDAVRGVFKLSHIPAGNKRESMPLRRRSNGLKGEL